MYALQEVNWAVANCSKVKYSKYTSHTYLQDTFQDHQWMPENFDSTGPYMYYIFSYTYIPMIKFNLQTRHKKRLTITTNNKTEQL